MKILDNTGKELMTVSKIEADDRNYLVIRGKIFGAMPMTARLSPEEARAALKLLDLKTVWFILTMLLRSARPAKKKSG
ncbi:hypothetical protein [Rhizobium sp. L1K21]|uniref:hypothetical protein n=1 Tax=Rhizobium sp. L1K21 TaxID=2954933 RepID=UPI002093CE0D|nr:hypothetical protein [Rhizobium sp. L1K21]MCO6187587.1 hypothetical protein [Rhizobium sp. L1K21]